MTLQIVVKAKGITNLKFTSVRVIKYQGSFSVYRKNAVKCFNESCFSNVIDKIYHPSYKLISSMIYMM